jgi:hypothetical protein
MAIKSPESGPRPYAKHGLLTLKRAIKELGHRAIDGRTSLAKALESEQRELVQALGGESEVSPQEKAIVQMIAMKRIRRRIASQWALLNPDKLFDRRKRAMAPLALQLEQLEESEAKLLDKLGLKRRSKPVQSLQDYVRQQYGSRETPAPDMPDSVIVPDSGGNEANSAPNPTMEDEDAIPPAGDQPAV